MARKPPWTLADPTPRRCSQLRLSQSSLVGRPNNTSSLLQSLSRCATRAQALTSAFGAPLDSALLTAFQSGWQPLIHHSHHCSDHPSPIPYRLRYRRSLRTFRQTAQAHSKIALASAARASLQGHFCDIVVHSAFSTHLYFMNN